MRYLLSQSLSRGCLAHEVGGGAAGGGGAEEGPWNQSQLPQDCDFSGLKVLHSCAGTADARLGVLKGRASGRRWAGRGRGSWGTHKKPGVVGSDPEQSGQAGGAFQLRFRGGASPA